MQKAYLWQQTTRKTRRTRLLVVLVVVGLALASCYWAVLGFSANHSHLDSGDSAISVSNVSSLTMRFSATAGDKADSSPAVAGGVVYIGTDDHKLSAFDASGQRNCTTRAPAVCAPVWTALTSGYVFSSPVVAGGEVYVGSGTVLYAFDAAGSTNCSGTPKTCAPLWTAKTGSYGFSSSPAVAKSVVYIGSGNGLLYAFSAAGSTTCSGTPKTCAPLWTGRTGAGIFSTPAVANGVVFIGSFDHKLYAFDAAGSTIVRAHLSLRPARRYGARPRAVPSCPLPPWSAEWSTSAPATTISTPTGCR